MSKPPRPEPNRSISHTEESTRYDEIKEEVKVSSRNLLSITFCCMELLESIFKDPRVIEFWPCEDNTGTFSIVIEGDENEIRYCPFCGTRIRGIEVNIINS